MPHRSKNSAIDEWLKKEIKSGKHKGLSWVDERRQIFRIPWVHASRRQYQINNDASLYKSWAKFKKRYKEGKEAVENIVCIEHLWGLPLKGQYMQKPTKRFPSNHSK